MIEATPIDATPTIVSPDRRRRLEAGRADEGRDEPRDRVARVRLFRRLQRLSLRDDARGPAHAEDNVLARERRPRLHRHNSIPLIQGSEIDYVDTLMGAGFTVNNPNAVSGCGCGSSFRTAEDAGTARSCSH